MADLTLDDLMRRSMAGEYVGQDQYEAALKALAGAGAAPDPASDPALAKMLEAKGSVKASALADLSGLGEKVSGAVNDATLKALYESGASPAEEAYSKTLDAPPPKEAAVPGDPATTLPEAVSAAQADPSALKLHAVDTAENLSEDPLARGTSQESASAYERALQEQRRAARAKEYQDFIKNREEPGLGPLVGRRESQFYEQEGKEYGGNKWLAALSDAGTAAYDKRSAAWQARRDKAREEDTAEAKENRLISNAMVGLIARTNPAIPLEEIANMREGDPLVKLMGQGGLGQDYKLTHDLITLRGKEDATKSAEERTRTQAGATVQAAKIAADARVAAAKKGGGGGGTGIDAMPTYVSMQVSTPQAQITTDTVSQFLAGTLPPEELAKIPEEKREEMRRFSTAWKAASREDRGKFMTQAQAREGKTADDLGAGVTRKANDPIVRDKVRTPILAMGKTLQLARKAWEEMSGPSKAALAAFDGRSEFGNFINKLVGSEKDAANNGRLRRLLAAYRKMQTGLASTDAEARELTGSAGFGSSNYDWLNSPASIQQFLDDSDAELKVRIRSANKSFPGIWK